MQSSRTEMGESGSLPAGASCNVSPNGVVTVLDPRARRSYLLTPLQDSAPSSDQNQSAPPIELKHRRFARIKTASVTPPPNRAPNRLERAFEALTLLQSRDEEPSDDNPLVYRERMFAVDENLGPRDAERLANALLRKMRDELSDRDEPKFIHLVVFDHAWEDHPMRPPMVRLQFKDWRSSIDIEFPLEDALRAASPSKIPPPPPEERMAYAFEACRDLLFLRNRAEALHFATQLIDELVENTAVTACLYDIEEDCFRVVAATGPNAHERPGTVIASGRGLYDAAADLSASGLLESANATEHKRYDEEVDAVEGVDMGAVLYKPLVHDDRLYGMLQIIGRAAFDQSAIDVVSYVGGQVSVFIAQGPSVPPPAPA